jgi:tRNA(fMet)-specific endonuclease VapC
MIYVLDTSTCVHYLRGKRAVLDQISVTGWSNLYISEITIIELFYGLERGGRPEKEDALLRLLAKLQIIPIRVTYRLFAIEKAKLAISGTLIEDFDLLIACAALYKNAVVVTSNTKHFNRITDLTLEDWYAP